MSKYAQGGQGRGPVSQQATAQRSEMQTKPYAPPMHVQGVAPPHGICSHILAYTHLKGQINLHEQLQQLAPRRAAYRPALPKGRNRIQPEEEEGPELPELEEPEEQDLLGA